MKKIIKLLTLGCGLLTGTHAMAEQSASLLVVLKAPNVRALSGQPSDNQLLTQSRHQGFKASLVSTFKPTRHIFKDRLQQWQVPQSQLEGLLQKLNNDPTVEFAEPNFTVYIDQYDQGPIHQWAPSSTTTLANDLPSDPAFYKLWGLNNTGQTRGTADADIDAPEAWKITTGSKDIAIGIIDTGIDYNHPDLVGNMWTNPNEIPGDGIDNAGNGYIDDIHGINTATGSGDPMDDHSHGTHVAGTIGASANNHMGIAGVNHHTSMIGCKFIKASGGGSIGDAIKCLDYFIDLKLAGTDVRLTNNSWGGGSRSEAMVEALQRSHEAGMLFVSSAGNAGEDNDAVPHYPSSYEADSILSVASTTHMDNKSGFSNYGKTSVDLGAPGSDIYSTMPNDRYASKSGTSMASPHAAGVAALILAANPGLSHTELKTLMMESGDALPALENNTVSGKRINVASAIEAAALPTWYLTSDVSSQTVKQGESGEFVFTVQGINDWQGHVDLAVSGGLTVDISTNPVPADGSSVITVSTNDNTAVGKHQLQLTASANGVVRSQIFSVTVEHANQVSRTYNNATVTDIPDDNDAGVESVINVNEDFTLLSGEVSVDITHSWRGDLQVSLVAPDGQITVLHNRTGSSQNNLKKTWNLDELNGNALGQWTLLVKDLSARDQGTINNWSLTLTGTKSGQDPVTVPKANFLADVDERKVTFTDTSTDEGLDIIEWSWNFGDGSSSDEQNPTHTFANAGSWNVSLTVTDSKGNTDTMEREVVIGGFAMSLASQIKQDNGDVKLRFTFGGSDTIFLNMYRDNRFVRSVFNIGETTDTLRNASGKSYTYKVCDNKGCSNEVVVEVE
ncbi:MAG: S8 family serine peptidase [Psychrosphaera sp.]|nr:S8 family serine peptidase [Psychrosphaera sp.]